MFDNPIDKTFNRVFYICWTLTFLLIFNYNAEARPRFIDLQNELNAASIVLDVNIVEYGSDRLKISSPINSKELLVKYYELDPNWNPSQLITNDWEERANNVYTAKWPPVGSEILIVVNEHNTVSLFAWKRQDAYRFWSPHMTGSVALFKCAATAAPINPSDEINKAWDGCLMPTKEITLKEMNITGKM